MNMQKNFKGRIVVNGAHVEVETDSPSDLAVIISNVVNSPRIVAQVVKTRGPAAENTNEKTTRRYRFKAGRQNGYHKWTENDVVKLAKLSMDWGKVRTGLGKHAYKVMKEEGEVTARSKMNVMIIVDRFHRYFHYGNNSGINDNFLKIFDKNNLRVLSGVMTQSPGIA